MNFKLILVCSMVGLAGCAAESRLAPRSTDTAGAGPASTEPESANSLPRGSSVDRPLTSAVGDINTTRVGPGSYSSPVVAARGAAPARRGY